MLLHFSKKYLLNSTLLLVFCFASETVFSQNNQNQLYDKYDEIIGEENLNINVGPVHLNYDKTFKNQHRYFNSDQFYVGAITYNNQKYNKLNLKYDIYEDQLILKISNQNYNLAINLIKDNVSDFTIDNQNFKNLKVSSKTISDGFYQGLFVSSRLASYVKHFKKKKDIIQNTEVVRQYDYGQEFVIFYKEQYYKLNSKKDLTSIFPAFEDKINNFYLMNKTLEKENKKLFIENIMKYINNLLPSELN